MAYSDPKLFSSAASERDGLSGSFRYVADSRLKRAFDLVASFALLLMVLPLLVGIAVILWATGGGKVLELRPVIGWKGAEFNRFSFHTDRSSRFGRWMQGSGLASLPQLLNVLVGQMSLVGPQPLRIDEFDGLKYSVSLYMSVRPGLTGLWLVSEERGLGAAALTRLDRIYIKTGTFFMDVSILLRTPFVFLRLA